MSRSCLVVLSVIGAFAFVDRAKGEGADEIPAPVNLYRAKIDDRPVRLSVPVSRDLTLVLSLPEHYWIRCRSALTGDGMIVDYIPEASVGSQYALIAVGSVPLPAPVTGERRADRVHRAAVWFVASLADKWSPSFELLTEPEKIKVGAAAVKLDGEKVYVERSSRFNMRGNGSSDPQDLFVCECLAFSVEGTETLFYISLNTKAGGTTIERLVDSLSVQKRTETNPTGQRVALIDASRSSTRQFASRLTCYNDAAGFCSNCAHPIVARSIVFAADRVDERGEVTASHRLRVRDPCAVPGLEAEGYFEMKLMEVGVVPEPRRVGLATPGMDALVYDYDAGFGGRDAAASTAVMRVDDRVWAFTWYTFGDAALVAADRLAFEKLLASMQVAVR